MAFVVFLDWPRAEAAQGLFLENLSRRIPKSPSLAAKICAKRLSYEAESLNLEKKSSYEFLEGLLNECLRIDKNLLRKRGWNSSFGQLGKALVKKEDPEGSLFFESFLSKAQSHFSRTDYMKFLTLNASVLGLETLSSAGITYGNKISRKMADVGMFSESVDLASTIETALQKDLHSTEVQEQVKMNLARSLALLRNFERARKKYREILEKHYKSTCDGSKKFPIFICIRLFNLEVESDNLLIAAKLSVEIEKGLVGSKETNLRAWANLERGRLLAAQERYTEAAPQILKAKSLAGKGSALRFFVMLEEAALLRKTRKFKQSERVLGEIENEYLRKSSTPFHKFYFFYEKILWSYAKREKNEFLSNLRKVRKFFSGTKAAKKFEALFRPLDISFSGGADDKELKLSVQKMRDFFKQDRMSKEVKILLKERR